MEVNDKIAELGRDLWAGVRGEVPGLFDRDYWQGKLLDWVMDDPDVRVDMFRLVDVLPVLGSRDSVARHVREYLLREGRELPGVLDAALRVATGSVMSGVGAFAVRKNVTDMARRFIVGENAAQSLPALRRLYGEGFAFTVDLLGEATISDSEAETYRLRYADLIEKLSHETARWPGNGLLENNHAGAIPRTNVSIKVSAMDSQLDAVDPAGGVERLKRRVLPLFLAAKERGVFVNVDLEKWDMHDITYDLFEELACHPELRDYPHMGIVVQAYLKTAHRDLERLRDLARRRGAPITVRLVKGAYWDYEVVHARQCGHECPVFEGKSRTDASYETLSARLLESADLLYPAFGSHNLRSLSNALVLADEMGLPKSAVEIQMLHGMAEPMRKALAAKGYRVRVYSPIGELLPGMAYLVRRLLENTSNSGFLKLSFHDGKDMDRLLAPPEPEAETPEERKPFVNCPLSDFTEGSVRKGFGQAVEDAARSFPVRVPAVVDGKERFSNDLALSSPGDRSLCVSEVTFASREEAERALAVAKKAREGWRSVPLDGRAEFLNRLGDRLEADRFRLASLMTYESAKPWR